MVLKFLIVSDSEKEVLGGIENHSKILRELLFEHGYNVTWLNYKNTKTKLFKNIDIIVYEGIHRMKLLQLLLHKKRNVMILFTHGSFYLESKERRFLRKYDSTKHQLLKIIFDRIFMKAILNKFDRIVTLSNSESKDISDLFNLEKSKLHYLDVFSDEIEKDDNLLEINDNYFIKKKYICYIGRLDYRKNLISLLQACVILDLTLIIAGQDQGMLSELKKYSELHKFDKFNYVGIISKEEKLLLIKNSLLVVIPSFFEGTPVTAKEALKLGKKVVMTKNSYMDDSPCICKVNPDTDSIVCAINESLDSNICDGQFVSNKELFTKFINLIGTPMTAKKERD